MNALRILAVAPELMPETASALAELQRSGHVVYPLQGQITEQQLAEQCIPEHQYDAVVFLTEGSGDGVMLAYGGSVWLPTSTVAAYVQACKTVRVVMLAVCRGSSIAREIFLRCGALVVYSENDLEVRTAFSLVATFWRAMRGGTIEDAVNIADTLGLRVWPRTLRVSPDRTEAGMSESQEVMFRDIAKQLESIRLDIARLQEAQAHIQIDVRELKERGEHLPPGWNGLWVLLVIILVSQVAMAIWIQALH